MRGTFLMIWNRLRFIVSTSLKHSEQSVLLLATHHLHVIPFSSSFFNQDRQTCHLVENFLVLDWSPAAFGAFSFFFSSTTLETPETFPHFLFCTWSESWESMGKQSCNVAKHVADQGLFLQWKILFEDPQSQENTMEALTLYGWIFVNSLQFARKHICSSEERSLFKVPCLPVHRWLDSAQQSYFVEVLALCNYYEAKPYCLAGCSISLAFRNRNGKFMFWNFLAKIECKNFFILQFI